MFFSKEKRRDKVLFLKEHGATLRILGHKYVKPSTDSFRFRGKTFKVPKQAEYLNSYGRFRYFINYDTGTGIHFSTSPAGRSRTPELSPKEHDIFLRQGLVEGFIRAFAGMIKYDKMLLLFALAAGIGIGYITGTIVMRL